MNESSIRVTEALDYAEQSYLNYAMYVILDRSLPHVADGLKPVQRRIVFAMSELGLDFAAKHKKSARTVGDVLGKYHPHGDSACYEAMVLMAQPFSYRYPLIDGQGNWGSIDEPKSFAAMRYTESKLTGYANTMLAELKYKTVDYKPNFDGTMEEPVLLPAQLPNILLNGASGIAVGMATDIPPHNLREVVNAVLMMIDDPSAPLDHIMAHIKGPDFPTNAEIITPPGDIYSLYEKGNGSIRMRACYHTEKKDIVITSLPYKVSGEKVIGKLAELLVAKRLPMLEDLRDESDYHNPTRIILKVKKGTVMTHDQIMSHLFAITELESSIKVNMNMIGLNGLPQVKNLQETLQEWIVFRRETVKRKLQFQLDRISKRLHLINGLLIAYLNMDEVIRIIRESDEPKKELISSFDFSDLQADYILDTKLRNLAKLEEEQLVNEKIKLSAEGEEINSILGSELKMNQLIKADLKEVSDKYGNDRRSPLKERAAAELIDESVLLPTEPISIILSKQGWIRSGKGHALNPESLSYRAGDSFMSMFKSQLNQQTVLLDSTGRIYQINNQDLPSARSYGEPVSTMIDHPSGSSIVSMLPLVTEGNYLVASSSGYGFVCPKEEFSTRNKKGKLIINCLEGEVLEPVVSKSEDRWIGVSTHRGYFMIFELSMLPILKKGKGNRIISLGKDDKVESIITFGDESTILVSSQGKSKKMNPGEWSSYISQRAKKGVCLSKKTNSPVSLSLE